MRELSKKRTQRKSEEFVEKGEEVQIKDPVVLRFERKYERGAKKELK